MRQDFGFTSIPICVVILTLSYESIWLSSSFMDAFGTATLVCEEHS
jgi:hypothetical protein